MNNLKFRAWHKEVKKYYEVEAIDFMTEEIMYIYDDYYNEEQAKEWFDFKDIIIEQYTVLKDVNGKEIYEGDILECEPMMKSEKDKTIRYVRHNGIYFVAQVAGDFGNMLFDCVNIGVTIIGNIHENGELFK